MQRFEYLVSKRDRCLSVFHKVARKLTSLNEKIEKEVDLCLGRSEAEEESIKKAKKRIEDNQAGIKFLDQQAAINKAQIEKITALVTPEPKEI